MNIRLIAPLVYYYPEEYAQNKAENAPNTFEFGYNFKIEKIDRQAELEPLFEKRLDQSIFSDYHRNLILDYATYAITRTCNMRRQESASSVVSSEEINETKRLLGLLRMALGISKRTHLIFPEFYVKESEKDPFYSTSLSLEGSNWDAHNYYPVDVDVSYKITDLERAKGIFNTLVNLAQNYSRVFNASYYFEMARLKGDRDYRLQFTLLVTSLESIFNTSPNQVSETLSLRYAHLMFKDPVERLRAYNRLKEIYTLRSRIVHGQQIPKKYLVKTIQDELLGDLEYLTRELLVYIFENNLVTKLNSKEVDEFFAKITLDDNPGLG